MCALRSLLRLLAFAAAATVPALAHAQAGGFIIQNIFINLIFAFAPLWITVAILIVVIAGFTLMLSQQEEALDKAKKTIIAVIMGGILTTILLVIGPLSAISAIYNGLPGITLINTGAVFGNEAIGVAEWLIAMAAMIGIMIIIIAVLKAVVSFGNDEAAYQNVRSAVVHVIIGLIVIAGAYIIRNVFFFTHEPSALIGLLASKILLVLGFILIIAVAMLIFAGLRMIVSFGREEEYSAAKGLVLRVIVGIIVILLSYAVVLAVALIFQ